MLSCQKSLSRGSHEEFIVLDAFINTLKFPVSLQSESKRLSYLKPLFIQVLINI